MLHILISSQTDNKTISGDRVQSKIKYITKPKVLIKFYPNTTVFLIGLIEFYQSKGYLTDKQYSYLDKYYTLARRI